MVAGLVASAVLVAVAVVSTGSGSRRSELAAVLPPFAASFGAAKTQGLWSPKNELRDKARQREQYWQQQNQGIEEGLLDPMDTFAAPRRMQALRGTNGNWQLDLTSPRLQAAEQAKYDKQEVDRYNLGEEVKSWDPTTWHNVVGAHKIRMQGLSSQANEPWNLDASSGRLQDAEKKAYYKLRKERFERGETNHGKYPSDEEWIMPAARGVRTQGLSLMSQAGEPWNLDASSGRLQDAEKKAYYKLRKERFERGETNHGKYPSDEDWVMPAARGARMTGLFAQPFDDGWKVDETSARLKRAEKKAYLKNEAQRYFRGESDGPSPWNGEYQGKM